LMIPGFRRKQRGFTQATS